MTARQARTQRVRQAAEALGFDLVQVTTAEPLEEARAAIKERVALGFFTGMDWFTAERADVSSNPQALLPQARSVLALGTFYLTDAPRDLSQPGAPHGQISCYAWGGDYHEVIRQRLEQLADELRTIAAEESAEQDVRLFVDTGRMVDRAVAARAGLGWFGKNTNILTRQWGSWLFLAEIVTALELEPDAPLAASCGHCRVCLDACPTHAFVAPGVLDARRCISYLTIEHRGAIPLELRPLIGNWIFGCDVCQQVCPVNLVVERRLRVRGVLGSGDAERRPQFVPQAEIGSSPALIALLALDETQFRERFRHSPIKRAKRRGLLRNVCVALGNARDAAAVPALSQALQDDEALVRSHAAWALGCIGGSEARVALEAARLIELIPEVQAELRYALALVQSAAGTTQDDTPDGVI